MPPSARQYTLLWQVRGAVEREWLSEIFGDLVCDQVDDSYSTVIDDCIVVDSRIHRAPSGYYPQFAGRRNVFLLHLSDEWFIPNYSTYSYFNGIFRNYGSAAFHPKRVMCLPLGYRDRLSLAVPSLRRPGERRYVWSFLGELEKSSRPEMARALNSIEPHLLHMTDRPGAIRLGPQAYHEALLDSIFAPCPMGNVNLESFRIYEALECGAIPLLESRITLDFFRLSLGAHPLPTFLTWSGAAKFVRQMLSTPKKLQAKQDECLAWWRGYKHRLHDQIQRFLEDRGDGPKIGAGAVRGYQRLPGWQAVELARHHSGAAILRRAVKEGRRLAGGRPPKH